MKPLTPYQLIEICAATAEQCQHAALLMGRSLHKDHHWIPSGVQAGHYTASIVKVNGTDRFFVAHHVSLQNYLNLNAVVDLHPAPGPDAFAFLPAMYHLAKSLSCKGIEAVTLRAGMVKRLVEEGFRTDGVFLVKELV